MSRVISVLVAVGCLGWAVSTATAGERYRVSYSATVHSAGYNMHEQATFQEVGHHRYGPVPYGYAHHAHYGPPVIVAPAPVYRVAPPVVAVPVYPPCYHPAPRSGVYVRGRNFAIGVDF